MTTFKNSETGQLGSLFENSASSMAISQALGASQLEAQTSKFEGMSNVPPENPNAEPGARAPRAASPGRVAGAVATTVIDRVMDRPGGGAFRIDTGKPIKPDEKGAGLRADVKRGGVGVTWQMNF